ncbi:MAG: 3-isopropylmalate dehydratase large subunit [Acidobacteria bacterium]|nr:3-isopropylmalate dehydratase large subunit [Acidobacteriota bacterium]
MAGMTLTEKIIAGHSGNGRVSPGMTVWVTADLLMTHDVCGPGTIGILKKEIGEHARVWDPDRVVIIPDHFIFTGDADARRNLDTLRGFVKEQGIRHFYDAGTDRYSGVCHVTLAERGHLRPGEILFGTDSHTCTAGALGLFATGIGNTDAAFVMATGKLWLRVPETMRFVLEGTARPRVTAKDIVLSLIGGMGVDGAAYRTMEFCGPVIDRMGIAERMTLCNMTVEAGAKSGIIAADGTTQAFLKGRGVAASVAVGGDPDARYHSERRVDVTALKPQVACPHSPDNVRDAEECRGIKVDRCYIGSCTGGKIEDFVMACEILDGRRVAVETCCVPATAQVARELQTRTVGGRTLGAILTAAGATIGPPSCAACLGGPPDTFGRLNRGEVCISTTNRNFPGRMGAPDSKVFLASPYTVAASAVEGRITDPGRFSG